ncbi:unnamed protein product [Cyprideis torosa]|uniref:Uncharacterized protein n=1 Tax=Cyprideis torosa TaxID=163714 RepID=A0A7R8ZPI6_9CRUS|nr:unnamed protein product [Cyprideis torosa]CAG0888455.1 unnamed protein product [Cyprideis torosa]
MASIYHLQTSASLPEGLKFLSPLEEGKSRETLSQFWNWDYDIGNVFVSSNQNMFRSRFDKELFGLPAGGDDSQYTKEFDEELQKRRWIPLLEREPTQTVLVTKRSHLSIPNLEHKHTPKRREDVPEEEVKELKTGHQTQLTMQDSPIDNETVECTCNIVETPLEVTTVSPRLIPMPRHIAMYTSNDRHPLIAPFTLETTKRHSSYVGQQISLPLLKISKVESPTKHLSFQGHATPMRLLKKRHIKRRIQRLKQGQVSRLTPNSPTQLSISIDKSGRQIERFAKREEYEKIPTTRKSSKFMDEKKRSRLNTRASEGTCAKTEYQVNQNEETSRCIKRRYSHPKDLNVWEKFQTHNPSLPGEQRKMLEKQHLSNTVQQRYKCSKKSSYNACHPKPLPRSLKVSLTLGSGPSNNERNNAGSSEYSVGPPSDSKLAKGSFNNNALDNVNSLKLNVERGSVISWPIVPEIAITPNIGFEPLGRQKIFLSQFEIPTFDQNSSFHVIPCVDVNGIEQNVLLQKGGSVSNANVHEIPHEKAGHNEEFKTNRWSFEPQKDSLSGYQPFQQLSIQPARQMSEKMLQQSYILVCDAGNQSCLQVSSDVAEGTDNIRTSDAIGNGRQSKIEKLGTAPIVEKENKAQSQHKLLSQKQSGKFQCRVQLFEGEKTTVANCSQGSKSASPLATRNASKSNASFCRYPVEPNFSKSSSEPSECCLVRQIPIDQLRQSTPVTNAGLLNDGMDVGNCCSQGFAVEKTNAKSNLQTAKQVTNPDCVDVTWETIKRCPLREIGLPDEQNIFTKNWFTSDGQRRIPEKRTNPRNTVQKPAAQRTHKYSAPPLPSPKKRHQRKRKYASYVHRGTQTDFPVAMLKEIRKLRETLEAALFYFMEHEVIY